MEQAVNPTKDLLDIIVQVLIVVLPVVIAWYIRTYVRGSTAERDVAAIIRLSNSAIDLVENLDKRGALDLPPDVSKGAHKLKLAGQWMESELGRAGIKISDEEAQQWIASEFQKRVGGVRMAGAMAELSTMAVDLVQNLEQRGLLQVPPGADRAAYLAELAAAWLQAELEKQGATVTREEALTWVRAQLLQMLQSQAGGVPVSMPQPVASSPLTNLAVSAADFVEQLKASGQLAPPPGTDPGQFEIDVAVSWAVTEAVKQGLAASRAEIVEAVAAVLRQRNGSPV
jgi:transposase